MAILEMALAAVAGAFVSSLGIFGGVAAKKGVSAGATKVKGWWNKNETRFSKIEGDITSLKHKVGL